MAWLLLGSAVFAIAHQRHANELARARRDAQRIEGLAPEALRIVDARVHARRASIFGDEVELREVRGRAGESVLPERVILGLPADGAAGAVVPGRGQRLLWPEAEVRLGIHVLPLRPARNPGSPDREQALARRGIAARARLVKPDWVVERVGGAGAGGLHGRVITHALAQARRIVLERVRPRLPSERPGAALVRALALGDRAEVGAPTEEAFRRLGLTHLLSVSGLHIGFVALPTAWLVVRARSFGRRSARRALGFGLPLAAGCIAGACYAALSGASVPAQRASGLFVLYALLRFAGISIRPASALACIACLLLLANPAHLFDPGAWFSFVACAALVAGGVWRESERGAGGAGSAARPGSRAASLAGALRDSLRISLVVSIAMLPLVDLAGLPRAPLGPLVNAVAIPWTGLVVMPCAFAAAVVAGTAPEAASPPDLVDALLVLLVAPAAGLEHATTSLAASLPDPLVDEGGAGRIAAPWLAGAIVVGILRLRRGDLVSGACVWSGLALLGFAPTGEQGLGGARPRAVFFDVGQADAALLETSDASWLIDTGPGFEDGSGGRSLLRALRAEGVRRIDRLVITHGDLDHRGGAPRILRSLPVGLLVMPAIDPPDPALEQLAALAGGRGVAVRRVAAGDRMGGPTQRDPLTAEVLWPPSPPRGAPVEGDSVGHGGSTRRRPARNDASLVLRVALGEQRLLMAADIGASVEAELLRARAQLRADLLKVAHHGSGQSSSAAFLAAVGARMAVVSAPCAGGRGLPNAAAIARLRAAGAGVAWTGRDGAIAVSGRRADALEVRQWGPRRTCAADRPGRASGGENGGREPGEGS